MALPRAGGKVLGDEYFVFCSDLRSPDGSVERLVDDLVGGPGGLPGGLYRYRGEWKSSCGGPAR